MSHLVLSRNGEESFKSRDPDVLRGGPSYGYTPSSVTNQVNRGNTL